MKTNNKFSNIVFCDKTTSTSNIGKVVISRNFKLEGIRFFDKTQHGWNDIWADISTKSNTYYTIHSIPFEALIFESNEKLSEKILDDDDPRVYFKKIKLQNGINVALIPIGLKFKSNNSIILINECFKCAYLAETNADYEKLHLNWTNIDLISNLTYQHNIRSSPISK